MSTDTLIAAIAADGAARPPSMARRMAVALGIGGLIALALFMQGLGMRPDIAEALQTWRFAAKVGIVLVTFAVALWAAARLGRPDASQRKALTLLLLPLLMLVSAIGGELAISPADTWSTWAIGSNARVCLLFIALMSVAPLVAVLAAMRAGAPRSPAMAGAVAGLLAGSSAALLYAAHCTDDSPLFVALWYPPPIALAMLAGAAAGSRVLRW
jgi:hypothetical protein